MRFPVFARRTSPSTAKPILRKSMKYLEEQVDSGVADWIDRADPRQGIVAREMLHFGERALPVETVNVSKFSKGLPALEAHGTRFDDPMIDSGRRQDRLCLVVRAQAFVRLAQLQTA